MNVFIFFSYICCKAIRGKSSFVLFKNKSVHTSASCVRPVVFPSFAVALSHINSVSKRQRNASSLSGSTSLPGDV